MKVATGEVESGPDEDRPNSDLGARKEEWQENARHVAEQARAWVVEHPFAALGIAITAGFVVGRVVRR